ncbi:hypothetical protein CSOJ01_09584 [Colletotrichum sojae]|uniref:Uncharacterized protein n=1 Tax=Colletotrichum sojae TaxID=2175907 RepID=A0A8H6J2V9_9PEZI|nr:hypothetical protein CSOJ01_09584 [Colletotrichum sojae]
MFIPGVVQALIAALTFGIVLNAASSAVFLFAKGHGSKIFRDGLRLVLITFLASAALWAQIDFAALTIDPTSTSGCQVAVIFTTIFDQLARFAIEQYLLWAINLSAQAPTAAIIPQAAIGTRFILGAVFVGFQKPQIATVCVSKIDVLPIGVVVMVVDLLIVAMLAFMAHSLGLARDITSGHTNPQGKKAVLWGVAGLALWTAGSIPMLLGIDNVELIWRTALPATALSLLIGILTGFSESLVPPRPVQATHADAQSPRNIGASRDISSSDSDYPPTRYEDLKAGTVTTVTSFARPRDAPRPDGWNGFGAALPIIAGSVPGQAATGVGGVPVQGQLFPPMRAQTAPARESLKVEVKPKVQYKRSIFDRGGPGASIKNAISNPILHESGEQNPLSKIATIDLATAAKNDKARRDNDMATMQRSPSLIAQCPAPQPPNITPEEALKRSQSLKRKEVGPTSPLAEPQPLRSAGLMSNAPAITSSAQLSPGVEEIRRRSPRQLPEPAQQKEKQMTPMTPKQAAPGNSISPPRPPRPERPMSPFETIERSTSQRTALTSASQKTVARSVSQKSTATSGPITSAQAVSPQTALVPPPPPKSAARSMSPKKPDLPSTWPIQSSVDPTIRPSRQKPLSPRNLDGAPQTGLQRRPTNAGLPSNPRAMTMKLLPKDATVPKEQTVMFVSNIQYNDPMGVQNIIKGAASQAGKTPVPAQSPGSALKSSGSIVHRPRPIPRQQGKDRQIFPAETSPNHKRSKSGGSIISRKSILLSNPGSPTQLPPLPPPPKSAGANPVRPLPNDTKSMTFNEKMDLFFPRPPSNSVARPRQSIPEIPMLPAAYKLDDNSANKDRGWETESSRDPSKDSDRSTKTSVRTQSILDIEELSRRPDYPRNTSKFSVDTSVFTGKPADDSESWIPHLPIDDRARSGRSYDGVKRQSSPVLPARNTSLSELSEARTRDEETTINWVSIHSPAAAVNIQEVRHMPKPTWIQSRDDGNLRDLSMISHNDGKEVMTIMLDASVEHERDLQAPLAGGERPVDSQDANLTGRGALWHRRVGDECVTFSERKEKVKSRRMPPPQPLQLRPPVKKNAIVLQVAEPSPLESPQHAYEMIQAQLKRFEEPNRDSYESQGQRIRLLESLEAEMGQQENQWHEMQHGLSRDSLSTVVTSSVRNSHQDPTNVSPRPRENSIHANIAADRRASRRTRMQSGGSFNKASYEDLRSASPASSDSNNRASLWQQRLADAQMEYMENATELLAKRNLNFLSVSRARASAQLGSPTPPDTDESDGADAQILARLMPKQRALLNHLWEPTSPVRCEREVTLLWAPTHDVANKPSQIGAGVALPGLSVRPASRKAAEPLTIASSQLWQPDHTAAKKLRTSTSGMWRASWMPEPPKPQSRPVTQRPPRRSKRITLLPDILESPEPLPDKRGTLGIFQFPWGEKSDTATVQARPNHMFMAMPGTMSTGGPAVRAALEARAKQLEAQEYSSSFFDDYDEEDEGDDEVSNIDEEDDSDDGFDETTLWEIASLLQSDQVPSKNSLLPGAAFYRPASNMEEYPSQESSEYNSEDEKVEDEDDTKHDSIVITVDVEEKSLSPQCSLLWTGRSNLFVGTPKMTGLSQPDAHTWAMYTETMSAPPRSHAQYAEPAVVQSSSLWKLPAVHSSNANSSLLWDSSVTSSAPRSDANTVSTQPQQRLRKTLWVAPLMIDEKEDSGLFDLSRKRATYKTTKASPVGLSMCSTARVQTAALPVLTSTNLWQPRRTLKRLWIAPPVISGAEPRGLFNTVHKRATFRTTSAPPIGLGMPSTGRLAKNEALPVITSTSLWQATQTTGKALWTPPVATIQTEPAGLFNVSQKRATYGITPAAPIGLHMRSTARATEKTLPVLNSSNLWAMPATAPQAQEWIAVGSIKPISPSIIASDHSTPSLDTASTRSGATDITSDFEPLPDVAIQQPAWWENSSEAETTLLKEAILQPLHRREAPPAEWDAALHEALGIASAMVTDRLVRKFASPEQWQQALHEAMLAAVNEADVLGEEPHQHQIQPQISRQWQQIDHAQYSLLQPEHQHHLDQQQLEKQQYEMRLEQQQLFEQREYERRAYKQQLVRQRYLEQQEYEQRLYFEQQQLERQRYFEEEEIAQQQYFAQMQLEQNHQYFGRHEIEQQLEEQDEQDGQTQHEEQVEPRPDPEQFAQLASATPLLWCAPESSVSNDSCMWVPTARPTQHIDDGDPLTPEDPESRRLRLKRFRPGSVTADSVSFDGQSVWNGLGAERVMPPGGGMDWLVGLPLMHM